MKNLLMLVCLMLFGKITFGQDIITQKNGEKLEVKIVELADDVVKFYYYDDPDQILVTMNRSLIREIKFEYGRKEEETNPGLDESYFIDDNRNNILVNFTSIASYSSMIGYEHSLNPTSSVGGGIKLHGVGANSSYWDDRTGFGVEVNYKVKTGSVFKKDQYRPNHLLQGFYIRPDLGFTSLEQTYVNYNDSEDKEKYSYFYGGFDIGNQWVFNNRLSLDIFSGINFYGGDYSYTTNTGERLDDLPEISDGNMSGSGNVAVRYGVQLGFLFR